MGNTTIVSLAVGISVFTVVLAIAVYCLRRRKCETPMTPMLESNVATFVVEPTSSDTTELCRRPENVRKAKHEQNTDGEINLTFNEDEGQNTESTRKLKSGNSAPNQVNTKVHRDPMDLSEHGSSLETSEEVLVDFPVVSVSPGREETMSADKNENRTENKYVHRSVSVSDENPSRLSNNGDSNKSRKRSNSVPDSLRAGNGYNNAITNLIPESTRPQSAPEKRIDRQNLPKPITSWSPPDEADENYDLEDEKTTFLG